MKIAIKYAFIICALTSVTSLIGIHLIGLENLFELKIGGILPIVIMAGGIFFGIKEYRKIQYREQKMNYGQALLSGITITLWAGLFLAIFNFVYFAFVNPGFSEEFIQVITPVMKSKNLKAAEIATEVKLIREGYLPQNMLINTFVQTLIMGLIFSSVFSAFLRNKDTFTQIFTDKK